MAQLPQEQKAKIAEQVASFQEEKSKLDAEVSKWDDSGNDIIVLAKQMCMIMMEMTDFTRWVYGGILSSSNPWLMHKKFSVWLRFTFVYIPNPAFVVLSSVLELICMYIPSYLNLNTAIGQPNYFQVRRHV